MNRVRAGLAGRPWWRWPLGRTAWATLGGLALLTLVASLPWHPAGPFDARDFSPLPDFRLEYPWWAVPAEPLLAPGHALMGAPDFRLAWPVALAWLAGLAALTSLVRGLPTAGGRGRWALAGRAGAAGLAALGMGVLYFLCTGLLHLPGWRLVPPSADIVIADFHSHSRASHDGLDAAATNLAWHARRGYSLVAVTDHDAPAGGLAAARLTPKADGEGPAVIPGVEVWERRERAFLLGLGLRPGGAFFLPSRPGQGDGRAWIETVHQQHGGAVIALYWKLEPSQVERLAELGVDGFEILNLGHIGMTPKLREKLLAVAASRGLVLVANTDWHGWSGYTRGWTAVRLPAAAALSPARRAEAVTALLAGRQAGAFVPVAAGYIGPPGLPRLVLAPFAEAVRYAGELSAGRVAAWWLWALGALAVGGWVHRAGLRPGRLGLCALAGLMGGALLWRGLQLTAGADPEPAPAFPAQIGAYTLGVAALALLACGLLVLLEWRRGANPAAPPCQGPRPGGPRGRGPVPPEA